MNKTPAEGCQDQGIPGIGYQVYRVLCTRYVEKKNTPDQVYYTVLKDTKLFLYEYQDTTTTSTTHYTMYTVPHNVTVVVAASALLLYMAPGTMLHTLARTFFLPDPLVSYGKGAKYCHFGTYWSFFGRSVAWFKHEPEKINK